MTQESERTRKYRITALVATLLFVAATFQIVNDNIPFGAILFGTASCFSILAGKYPKS